MIESTKVFVSTVDTIQQADVEVDVLDSYMSLTCDYKRIKMNQNWKENLWQEKKMN